MGFLDKMKASRLNSKATALKDEGRLEEAEKMYRQAIDINGASADPWHGLGLVYKYQSRWPEAQECHQKAVDLDPSEESWWWDLGIVATAAEDWPTARNAWKKCGLQIPEGDGPIRTDMGPAAIRIESGESAEVIWAERIDPTRAVIRGVPLPMSDRRWQDVVLHDGVPNGTRRLAGKEYPVFNELQVLESSDYKTFQVVAKVETQNADRALIESAEKAGIVAADWQGSIRFLCEICLSGVPHQVHTHEVEGGEHVFGFAAHREEEVRSVLDAWEKEWPECKVTGVSLVSGD